MIAMLAAVASTAQHPLDGGKRRLDVSGRVGAGDAPLGAGLDEDALLHQSEVETPAPRRVSALSLKVVLWLPIQAEIHVEDRANAPDARLLAVLLEQVPEADAHG